MADQKVKVYVESSAVTAHGSFGRGEHDVDAVLAEYLVTNRIAVYVQVERRIPTAPARQHAVPSLARKEKRG